MSNLKISLAASQLKNIIESTLKVPSRKISFGDTVDANWKGSNTTGVEYTETRDKGDLYVATWSPELGIVEVTEEICDNTHFYNGNHKRTETEGKPLCEVIKGGELLLIVGHGNDYDLDYTIYKMPNFKEYFSKLEESDIAKWSAFLSE